MDRIDLEQPRFTQAQVLKLVPALRAKDLQNWLNRGIFEVEEASPGRQGKRHYTSVGVIALAFMAELTALGIGPAVAYRMVDTLAEHALMVHKVYPTDKDKNTPFWVIIGNAPHLYHQGFVFKHSGKQVMLIRRDDKLLRPFLPDAYITVEVDFLVFWVLNRIYAFLAGESLSEDKRETNEFNVELLDALKVELGEAPEGG